MGALLVVALGCETPKQTAPREPDRDETTDRGASDTSTPETGESSEPLAFESLPASEGGSREALLYATPSEPRALLWVFHGRGGSREICRREHLQPAMKEFARAGFAVVGPQSLDRDERRADCTAS